MSSVAPSSSSSCGKPAEFDVPVTHRLHGAYANPLVRQWQCEQPPIVASELVYPIFVHDLDDEKHEIKSLPEQFRWGVNKSVRRRPATHRNRGRVLPQISAQKTDVLCCSLPPSAGWMSC